MAEPILTFTTEPAPVTDEAGAILGYTVGATLIMPNGAMTHQVGFASTKPPIDNREATGDHTLHPNPLLGAKKEAMRDAVRRIRRDAGC